VAAALSDVPSTRRVVSEAFSRARTPMFLQLQGRVISELLGRLPEDPHQGQVIPVLTAALAKIDGEVAAIAAHLELQETVVRVAPTRAAYERALLETARFLGGSDAAGDRAALSRWLDWDALLERGRRRSNRLRRLEQLGATALAQLLSEVAPGELVPPPAQLEGVLLEGVLRLRHPLVEREYVRAAGAALPHLEGRAQALQEAILNLARDPRRDLWSQRYALEALLNLDPARGLRVAESRLLRPVQRAANAFYLRRYILDECLDRFPEPRRLELVEAVLTADPSPHVRQGAVLSLGRVDPTLAWDPCRRLLLEDSRETCVEVRASVNLVLAAWSLARPREFLSPWVEWLARRSEPLVARVGLARMADTLEALLRERRLTREEGLRFAETLVVGGEGLGWDVPTRRRAEELWARVEVVCQESFAALAEELEPRLRELAGGEALDLRCSVEEVSPQELGRFLAWTSLQSEGFYAERRSFGYRITARGRPSLRAWRILHETRNPAPDKRQGHPVGHLRGWLRPGSIRAHSALLGEESPTRIPGEPVVCREEGSWRRFLPLVDDFLDALGREEVSIHSSEGLVTISAPRGWKGWRAWFRITVRYPRLSALRNEVRLGNPELDPGAYVTAFRELGFRVEFCPSVPPESSSAAAYFARPEVSESAEEDA